MQAIKTKCPMSFCYNHVQGPQDKHISWRSHSVIEQLNVKCDTLAGQAVTYGTANITPQGAQDLLLPPEWAAVVVD